MNISLLIGAGFALWSIWSIGGIVRARRADQPWHGRTLMLGGVLSLAAHFLVTSQPYTGDVLSVAGVTLLVAGRLQGMREREGQR